MLEQQRERRGPVLRHGAGASGISGFTSDGTMKKEI